MWALVDEKSMLVCLKSEAYSLGPFLFTEEATARQQMEALDGDVMPLSLRLVEVPTSSLSEFLQQDSQLDILSVNGVQFPLSERGAKRLDKLSKDSFWGPVFKRSDWKRIVASGLEEVIGEPLSMTLEEETLKPLKTEMKRVKASVGIEILPTEEGSYPLSESEYDGSSMFTVATHGLESLGHPELQLQYVPALFLEEAGAQLLMWAAIALSKPFSNDQILMVNEPFKTTLRCRKTSEGFVLTPEVVILDDEDPSNEGPQLN